MRMAGVSADTRNSLRRATRRMTGRRTIIKTKTHPPGQHPHLDMTLGVQGYTLDVRG